MTNAQIQRIYNTKMQHIMQKNARIKQEQDDAERAAWEERKAKKDRAAAGLALLNMGKDLRESAMMEMLSMGAGGEYGYTDAGGVPIPTKKYQTRDMADRGWLPEGLLPGGKKPKLGKIGATVLSPLEKTEGYREFKAGESLDEARSTVTIPEDTEFNIPGQDFTMPTVPVQEELAIDERIAYERLAIEEDVYTPVLAPTDPPDYAKIKSAADPIMQEQKLQQLRELETAPGVTPTEAADPELEKALQDLERLKAPKVKGADEVLPEQLRASVGMSDMPDVEAPVTQDVEIPDAKQGVGRYTGKRLNALQTGHQMLNIGKTLTDSEASGEDKALASTQGVKVLADLAAKKAGQKTAVEAVKAGTKIGGKAAVGAAAGGLIGGYTMVTEAGEAVESWKEGDYDEAILQGIGSVSGGLQAAGAGMMLSGLGAPLGALLFTVGTAGSVISAGGQFLEGLFGGSDAPVLPGVQKPKFDTGRYLESIRRQRLYN